MKFLELFILGNLRFHLYCVFHIKASFPCSPLPKLCETNTLFRTHSASSFDSDDSSHSSSGSSSSNGATSTNTSIGTTVSTDSLIKPKPCPTLSTWVRVRLATGSKNKIASLAEILLRLFDIHVGNENEPNTLGVVFNPDELHGHEHQTTVEDVGVDFNTDIPTTPSTFVLQSLALAGLRCIAAFSGPTQAKESSNSTISMILEKPPVVFPPQSSLHSYIPAHISSAPNVGNNIPPLSAWQSLWSAWDLVTLRMIPSQMLLQKPIDLRHKCLFYIGHIPTFLDMLISKAINQPTPTEPAYFWDIFERGIDPSVDDPDHCHNHSVVPTTDADWPSLTTIIGFRDRVRERLGRLYDELDIGEKNGGRRLTRRIARMLCMCYEHEAWHVETLLYMLIQRSPPSLIPTTLPPPGFTPPPFEVLARQWEVQWQNRSTTTIEFGPTEVVLGMDDSEGDDVKLNSEADILEHTYGWDNESPARTVHVMPFKAEWRPVSCGEFERFWRDSDGKIALPASWILSSSGEISVRSLYGPVPLAFAHTWPVQASYDALEAYARSKGGRIPNEAELKVILDYLNDDESFAYDGGANVGWRNWHPVCPTAGLTSPTPFSVSSPKDKSGKGHNGGIWEWTSTAFVSHEGFVGTSLFTGYSEDFWDGKHMVVLGGSYATLPRLTGRKTIRNFWQYNYPYAWVGARVVYDV